MFDVELPVAFYDWPMWVVSSHDLLSEDACKFVVPYSGACTDSDSNSMTNSWMNVSSPVVSQY